MVGKVDWSFTSNGQAADKTLKHAWQSNTQKPSQRKQDDKSALVDYCEFPQKMSSSAFKDFGI